jgi:hypothetical protein
MKKLLLMFISVLPCSLHAQEYESLLSESRVWNTLLTSSTANVHYEEEETKLMGDTIIDGIHYKRKYTRYRDYGEGVFGNWEAQSRYIGQDGAKIYQYNSNIYSDPEYNKPHVMIDLSLKVGDTFNYYWEINMDLEQAAFHVVAVSDTILPGDVTQKRRKCLYLERLSEHHVWVEGIGEIKLGLFVQDKFRTTGALHTLLKCSEGESVLYEIPMSTGISKICTESTNHSEAIYNLQGRRVQGQPKRGIYIQNRRKVMVK